MKSLAFVHLEFGQNTRTASLNLLGQFRQEFAAAGFECSLVVVDNARSCGVEHGTGDGWNAFRIIPGDNSNREFTGWDAGVTDVLKRQPEPDVWVFTNDTVATHHGWSLTRMRRFCAEAVFMQPYQRNWLLGEITDSPKPDTTPIGPILQWLPTYAFAMNGELRKALGTISPDKADLDAILEPAFEPRRKLLREGVEPGFLQQALDWLVTDDGPEARAALARSRGWKTHYGGMAPLTAQTFSDLSAKMRCTVSEAYLSVRAVQAGAVLRSPYEGQQGRMRLRSTIDFIKDKIAEKRHFRRIIRQRARTVPATGKPP